MFEAAQNQEVIQNKRNAWQRWVQETKMGRQWLFFHRQFLDQIVHVWQNQLLLRQTSFENGTPCFLYMNSILHDMIWCKNHQNALHDCHSLHDDKAQNWVNENLWRLHLQNQSLKMPHKMNDTQSVLAALTHIQDHHVDILCIPQLLDARSFKDVLDLAWQKVSHNGLLCIEQFNPLSLQYFLGVRLGLWALQPQNYNLGMQKLTSAALQTFAHQQGWASLYAKYHIYSFDFAMRYQTQQKLQMLQDSFLLDFDEKTHHQMKDPYSEKIGQRWFARFGLCYYLVLQKKGVAELSSHTPFAFNTLGSKAAAGCPTKTSL